MIFILLALALAAACLSAGTAYAAGVYSKSLNGHVHIVAEEEEEERDTFLPAAMRPAGAPRFAGAYPGMRALDGAGAVEDVRPGVPFAAQAIEKVNFT